MQTVSEGLPTIYASVGSLAEILRLHQSYAVHHFHLSVAAMMKAGVTHPEWLVQEALGAQPQLTLTYPVSGPHWRSQAERVQSWGERVWARVLWEGISDQEIGAAAEQGVRICLTPAVTLAEVARAQAMFASAPNAKLSLYAGRWLETGRDALELFEAARGLTLIWEDPGEALDVYQARERGCLGVTLNEGLLSKLSWRGKDLAEVSLETVQMFYTDASKAGYEL